MIVHAPAKLNLRLVITAREESGYHQLETVFCRLDLADRIELRASGGSIALEVAGAQLGPAKSNLAYRAAAAFCELTGTRGAALRLEKRIPAGAGLGGGSSDAAAVLLGLNRLHHEPLARAELLRLGGALGADVPFFLAETPLALAWGRGDRVLPLPALSPAPALLVLPPFPIVTAEAYRLLAEHRRAGAPTGSVLLPARELADWVGLAELAVNDFEAPLFARYPQLAAIRQALHEGGAFLARMTGSGSALFGVWRDAAQRAAAATSIGARFPDCRALPVEAGV
jgi:4-diphosphocytidyl-2-C-methyl-D-erythritol kinase